MSAKTDTYHTGRILERVNEGSPNAVAAISRLKKEIAEVEAIIAEDPSGAADMGFGNQLDLLKTVLSLLEIGRERKPLKIGIVGSRDYPRLDRVRQYVEQCPPGTTIVSGAGVQKGKKQRRKPGVDEIAETVALACGLTVIGFPPDWDLMGKAAGPARNTQIVEAAEDMVVAFWDGDSPGTQNTIKQATRAGRKVVIYPAKKKGESL